MRPLISGVTGAVTFSTFFPSGAIIFNANIPQWVKGVLGNGFSTYQAGAFMGIISSFVCENVSTVLSASGVPGAAGISLAQCFAASAASFVLVPALLDETPTSGDVSRLIACGVLTEMSSRFIFQAIFDGPAAGANSSFY